MGHACEYSTLSFGLESGISDLRLFGFYSFTCAVNFTLLLHDSEVAVHSRGAEMCCQLSKNLTSLSERLVQLFTE